MGLFGFIEIPVSTKFLDCYIMLHPNLTKVNTHASCVSFARVFPLCLEAKCQMPRSSLGLL